MRIACVHIPQLSLQCVTRIEPGLRAAALAVAGSPAGSAGHPALSPPVVVAVSRAAWTLGVRLGMTATAARAIATEVRVVHADPSAERELVRAVADALLAIAPTVDCGGRLGPGGAHQAMYVEVPSRLRGASFGERAVELLGALGLTGRVGIADDRFTAWVAASSPSEGGRRAETETGVTSVPRGGATAFLASKPLSLLAITPEVQRMLEALGVRTLGEFAALPAPSVARPVDRDYQALARGDGGTALRPYLPEAAIREDLAVGGVDAGLHNELAVACLAKRIALRLAGRGRLASRIELVSYRARGDEQLATVEPARAAATAESLAEALAPAISEGAWRVRATVVGEAIAAEPEAVAAPPAMAPPTDLLDVVLASPATRDLFGGLAPAPSGAEARYRRTRRGKQRERVLAPPQRRLFEG